MTLDQNNCMGLKSQVKLDCADYFDADIRWTEYYTKHLRRMKFVIEKYPKFN